MSKNCKHEKTVYRHDHSYGIECSTRIIIGYNVCTSCNLEQRIIKRYSMDSGKLYDTEIAVNWTPR